MGAVELGGGCFNLAAFDLYLCSFFFFLLFFFFPLKRSVEKRGAFGRRIGGVDSALSRV